MELQVENSLGIETNGLRDKAILCRCLLRRSLDSAHDFHDR